MRIRFLGKETDGGQSPTLYATDCDSYLIQGWKVTDPGILAKLDIPDGATVVEIYARLMPHLAKDGLSGIVMSWVPPIVHVMESGNLVIQGTCVTDPTALAEMAIPDHEDVVEVSRSAIRAVLKEEHEAADG